MFAKQPPQGIEKQLSQEDPLYSFITNSLQDDPDATFTGTTHHPNHSYSSSQKWIFFQKNYPELIDNLLSTLPRESYDEALQIINNQLHPRTGRPSDLTKKANSLEPEIIFFLMLRALFSIIDDEPTQHKAAALVGGTIEQEIVLRKIRVDNKSAHKQLKSLKIHSKHIKDSSLRKQYTLRYFSKLQSYKKRLNLWDNATRLNIGFRLINILCETSDLFSFKSYKVRENGKLRTVNKIISTDKLRETIQKIPYLHDVFPPNMPILCHPKNWELPIGGGYYAKFPPLSLIKPKADNFFTKQFDQLLLKTNLDPIFSAVNHLQDTPWKIRSDILEIINIMYQKDSSRFFLSQLTENNLHIANTLVKQEKFFYAYQLDYRGRAYSIGPWLHPQGNDIAKAILCFAKEKPLGEDGARYLAIHGSHLIASEHLLSQRSDRMVSVDERVEWIKKHSEEIYRSASDPMNFTWWLEISKDKSHFQFLAFCMEWKKCLEKSSKAMSNLPIAMDGTCNGLQHMSAMLGDELLAKSTNVVPKEFPSDIYQEIAVYLEEAVTNDIEKEKNPHAKDCLWLITRSLCKPIVMNIPYGLSDQGMKEEIYEYWKRMSTKKKIPEQWHNQDKRKELIDYLYRKTHAVIDEKIPSAKNLIIWLKECADAFVSQGIPITWKTPIGLPVLQPSFKMNNRQVKCEVENLFLRKYGLRITTDLIDKRTQRSSITPNLVHGCDASHMMRTVNAASNNGIDAFRMNHDSFATHAADAGKLAKVLREEFSEMYRKDILREFHQWIKSVELGQGAPPGTEELAKLVSRWKNRLPEGKAIRSKKKVPLPLERGRLDLSIVKKSTYFFS